MLANEIIPCENSRKKIFENIDREEKKNVYSSFYQKWVQKASEQAKNSITRNMKISIEKIQNRQNLYDLDVLQIKINDFDDIITEKFFETLEKKIYNNKFFLNEFVFVFDKVKAKPQECVLHSFKYDFYVKILLFLKQFI